MTTKRGDARLVIGATVAIVLAGLLVAVAILLVTGRSKTPGNEKPIPFGYARSLTTKVRKGGPVAFAGTSGDDGFWLALEHGRLVPLLVRQPGPPACVLRWRGSRDTFTCNGRAVATGSLVRYATEIPRRGDRKGILLVDLRHAEPAPTG